MFNSQRPKAKVERQERCRVPKPCLLLQFWLAPAAGVCLPPEKSIHLNTFLEQIPSRWPDRCSRPQFSPRTLTQQPSLLVPGPPQLVWLDQKLSLEQCLVAWWLAMLETHISSSSSSPLPFWALPLGLLIDSCLPHCLRYGGSMGSPSCLCCFDSMPVLVMCSELYHHQTTTFL